jgi:hypothetical protein
MPMAKDAWLKAQSKHFTLIGDAREKDIRNAGIRLEQFHEAFSQIVSQILPPSFINYSVPVTVIVFKNDSAYRPFKPLHQGRPADVSGHFQSSGDTAYIALAAGRSDERPYAVIFHEYVHALTSGAIHAPLPTWLSEGLAEYFSSFEASDGGKRAPADSARNFAGGRADIAFLHRDREEESLLRRVVGAYALPAAPGEALSIP